MNTKIDSTPNDMLVAKAAPINPHCSGNTNTQSNTELRNAPTKLNIIAKFGEPSNLTTKIPTKTKRSNIGTMQAQRIYSTMRGESVSDPPNRYPNSSANTRIAIVMGIKIKRGTKKACVTLMLAAFSLFCDRCTAATMETPVAKSNPIALAIK